MWKGGRMIVAAVAEAIATVGLETDTDNAGHL